MIPEDGHVIKTLVAALTRADKSAMGAINRPLQVVCGIGGGYDGGR
jgi:hypothetical protein